MKRQQIVNLLALGVLLALPVRADWLVTRDGARMETKGPWKVKGKLVVFETAEGKLSSLRVADVDLDASRRMTEEAVAARAQAEAEPEKAPERKKPVRVITDKDVGQAVPTPEAPAAEGEKAAPATGPTTGPGVLVETWNQARDPEKDHVLVQGTLVNASSGTATNLKLKVLIFDSAGSLMATSQAAVAKGALSPGQKTEFKADFPGFFSFATVKFEPDSRRLVTRPAGEPIPEAPPE